MRRVLPVITSVEKYIDADGTVRGGLSPEEEEALSTFRGLEYYWASHFAYGGA